VLNAGLVSVCIDLESLFLWASKEAYNFVHVDCDEVKFEDCLWQDLLSVTDQLEKELVMFSKDASNFVKKHPQTKIVTLWSHIFAPLLRRVRLPKEPSSRGISYTAALILTETYPPHSSWPRELRIIADIFHLNICASDLNTIDQHSSLLFMVEKDTQKELFDRIITLPGLSLEWKKSLAKILIEEYGAEKIKTDPNLYPHIAPAIKIITNTVDEDDQENIQSVKEQGKVIGIIRAFTKEYLVPAVKNLFGIQK